MSKKKGEQKVVPFSSKPETAVEKSDRIKSLSATVGRLLDHIEETRALAPEDVEVMSLSESGDVRRLRQAALLDRSLESGLQKIDEEARKAQANPWAVRLRKINLLVGNMRNTTLPIFKAVQLAKEFKILKAEFTKEESIVGGLVFRAGSGQVEHLLPFDESEETVHFAEELMQYRQRLIEQIIAGDEIDFPTAVKLANQLCLGSILTEEEAQRIPAHWKLPFPVEAGTRFYHPSQKAGNDGVKVFRSLRQLRDQYKIFCADAEKQYLATTETVEPFLPNTLKNLITRGKPVTVQVELRERPGQADYLLLERLEGRKVVATKATSPNLARIIFRRTDRDGRVQYQPLELDLELKSDGRVFVHTKHPAILAKALIAKAKADFAK